MKIINPLMGYDQRGTFNRLWYFSMRGATCRASNMPSLRTLPPRPNTTAQQRIAAMQSQYRQNFPARALGYREFARRSMSLANPRSVTQVSARQIHARTTETSTITQASNVKS